MSKNSDEKSSFSFDHIITCSRVALSVTYKWIRCKHTMSVSLYPWNSAQELTCSQFELHPSLRASGIGSLPGQEPKPVSQVSPWLCGAKFKWYCSHLTEQTPVKEPERTAVWGCTFRWQDCMQNTQKISTEEARETQQHSVCKMNQNDGS